MQHVIPNPGAFVAGIAIFLVVVWDAFESIILPRRVTRKFRLTRLFYNVTWEIARFVATRFSARWPPGPPPAGRRRSGPYPPSARWRR